MPTDKPLTADEARVLRAVRDGNVLAHNVVATDCRTLEHDGLLIFEKALNGYTWELTRAGALALAAYKKEHDGKEKS